MAARTFKRRHRNVGRMTEEEGDALEEQFHARRHALKLKAKKLKERPRPAGQYYFEHTRLKGKKRLLELHDSWEAEYDTIE